MNEFRFLLGLAAVLVAAVRGGTQAQTAAPAPGDAACLKCHAPVEAALRSGTVHKAVERGCGACHADHRQSVGNPRPYLRAPEPALCFACHEANPTLAAAHQGQPLEHAVCTHCHDPHASRAPRLIYPGAHGPFAGRRCDECHSQPQDGKVRLVASSVNEVCYGCHVELKNRVAAAAFRHTALDSGSCIDCHDPHASIQERHLKRPVVELCEGCHAPVAAGKKFMHGSVRLSCVLCHEPHASGFPRQLRAGVNDLCLECHGAGAVGRPGGRAEPGRMQPVEPKAIAVRAGETRGHPVPNHPVSRPAGAGKTGIDCLSCHRAHATRGGPALLVTETRAALCSKCHR